MKIILVTFVSLFIGIGSVQAQDTLVFSKLKGLNADISLQVLQEAYQRLGIPIKGNIYPPARALVMSNDGKTAGEIHRMEGIEKQYPNLIRVSVAVNHVEVVVFTKDVIFEVTGWEALKPYTIGIRRGIKYAEKNTNGMDVTAVDTYQQVLKMLAIGRIDIGLTTRVTGILVLKELQLGGIRILEPPLLTIDLYHYLNKKHADLVPKITRALHAMEQEGRIEAIRDHFVAEIFQ